jgi:hypothetical protein
MIARYAIGIVALIASTPTLAEPLDAAAAQRFVLGKLFAFTCFDSSHGAGRIYGDGSVMGTVELRGAGSIYSVWLPAGTLKVKGETVCASLSGISISTERMIKASAAQCPAWILHIAISLTART